MSRSSSPQFCTSGITAAGRKTSDRMAKPGLPRQMRTSIQMPQMAVNAHAKPNNDIEFSLVVDTYAGTHRRVGVIGRRATLRAFSRAGKLSNWSDRLTNQANHTT